MSTRSGIVLKDGDVYTGIYCHWDGYPDGVGKTLKDHYTDIDKIKQLIDLGAISSLEMNIAPPEGCNHSFANKMSGVTTAYHRDRGDEKRIFSGTDLEETKRFFKESWAEYLYVFDGNIWNCYELCGG